MPTIRKPITKSRTTKHVAAGAVGGSGVTAAVLAAVRSMWPDLLPWSVEVDVLIAGALGALLTPLLSRWTAKAARANDARVTPRP